MGLNPWSWGWAIGTAIVDLFTNEITSEEDEKRAIQEAEATKKAEPKSYEPVDDNTYEIPLPEPEPEAKPVTHKPPKVTTTGTDPDGKLVQAGFPKWWEWLPGPWLYNQLRPKPDLHDPKYAQNIFQFGRLMVNNHVDHDLTQYEWDYLVSKEDSQVALQASYEAFIWWLGKQGGLPNIKAQVGDFYDQGALFWPVDIRAFQQGIALIYGIQAPADIFANCWSRSRNAVLGTIRGTTWKSVTPFKISAEFQRQYYEYAGEADSALGQEGLAYSLSEMAKTDENSPPRIVLQNAGLGGLHRVLASDAFPIKVPVSLLLEEADLAGMSEAEIEAKAYEKINSMPQLLLWLTRALDELIGKFPITMEIAENDLLDMNDEYAAWKSSQSPVNENDLPFYLQNDKLVSYREENGQIVKTVKVPNLAEAMAEVLGLNIAEQSKNDLGVEMLTRLINELGSTKNVVINANAWTEAIADYLGFQAQDKNQKVPYTYNPVLELKDGEPMPWAEFLKPTEVETAIPEFSDKLTLEAKLEVFKEAHAIIKAALTEGIGKTDGQMMTRVYSFANEMGIKRKQPDNPDNPDQAPEKDDFDRFLEDVEYGFINQGAWADDSTKPYGRELDQRPRIKRLTAPTTETA